MKTTTFKMEILAPIQEVWRALTTTEGMNTWAEWLKIETDWQLKSPIAMTCHDDKGEVMEYNGEKLIFNGIIDIKKENKEITYLYPEKTAGIERESYVLDEIDAGTTSITFTQTCTTEENAIDQQDAQKQLMEILKKKLEENL